jgi:hypothetical protein
MQLPVTSKPVMHDDNDVSEALLVLDLSNTHITKNKTPKRPKREFSIQPNWREP